MSKTSIQVWLIGVMSAAVLNSGCTITNPFMRAELRQPPADKSRDPSFDHNVVSSSRIPSEPQTVVQAQAIQPVLGGVTVSRPNTRPVIQQAAAMTTFGVESQPVERDFSPPVPTIPQVISVPTLPAAMATLPAPAVAPAPAPAVAPAPTPTVPSVPTHSVMTGSGPNVRATPTVSGGILGLAPNEQPLDRVLEMAKQIDARDVENKVLQARIKTLEANAASREDSLNESIREVDTATSEVLKARNELVNLRKELAVVKSKLSLAEKDEIETLKLIVEALEKVLAK